MGWTHIAGSTDHPAVTGRSSFAEVIQTDVLRQKLAEINLIDGLFEHFAS